MQSPGARCEWERGQRGRRAGECGRGQAAGGFSLALGARYSVLGDERSIGDTLRPHAVTTHSGDLDGAQRNEGGKGLEDRRPQPRRRSRVSCWIPNCAPHSHPCVPRSAANLPCRSADPFPVALQPRLVWTHRQAPHQLHSFHHPVEAAASSAARLRPHRGVLTPAADCGRSSGASYHASGSRGAGTSAAGGMVSFQTLQALGLRGVKGPSLPRGASGSCTCSSPTGQRTTMALTAIRYGDHLRTRADEMYP